MILIDSHCHLDFDDFKNDFDQVLINAKDNNIQILQTICTKISKFDKILNLVNKYENIYGSVGIHPHEVAAEKKITADELCELANHPKIIGIGETGLDYYYEHSDRELQKQSFIEHIKAARNLDIPIIIHTRDAEEDTMSILESEMKKGKFRALIHCFTASENMAEFCIANDILISVSGIVTFKNAVNLQNIVKNFPLSKILIETDSPYLAPVPNRGKRNEPAFVIHTAEYLANLKNISLEEVALTTTENFYNLFSKVKVKQIKF